MSVLGDLVSIYGGGLNFSNMGVASQDLNLTNALNAAICQHNFTVAQATQVASPRPLPIHVTYIASVKIATQVQKLVEQLPMSIAGGITSCAYYERDREEAARFVITFTNQRTLTFYDVDNFPSDEHVGRIALEASP